MMLVNREMLFAMIFMVPFATGCSRESAPAPVSGTITYQGQPLAEAIVSFIPVAGGRPAIGQTDDSGCFTLTTSTPEDGAMPGDHVVIVQKLQPREGDGQYVQHQSVIPERYGDVKLSDLRATVALSGPNQYEFALKK